MLPVHSQGRAGHRRSYSQTTGAFTSLGALPRRRSSSNIPHHYPVSQPKKPTFHFRQDQDDDDDDDDDESHDIHEHILPPLRLKLPSFNAVPFPRTSPLHSPTVPRLLLSNGKPLKSSLKSSSSSPNIPFPSQSLVPSIMFPDLHPKQPHQRASSAPCTPLFASSPESTSPSSSSPPHSPTSSFHHVCKNVHFPSQEEGGLATIRVFNRSARPASLSRLGEETETETEGEGSSTGNGGWPGWSGKYVGGSTFPFPRVPADEKEKKSPLNPAKQMRIQHEIDWSQSSGIPRKNVMDNVFFESLQVVEGADDETVIQGTLLVRNITYQKTVMVRYTLDNWETVNDVAGWYHVDEPAKNGWDRFKFSISLGGSQQGLEKRVMWMVGKYAGGSDAGEGEGGDAVEWWDNNEGKNYRVAFKKVEEQTEKVYKRGVAFSAPTTPTSTLTRPKLSAPQISSSSSFPFSGQQHLSQYQQEREKERERERAQHQAAITQSTLARLKHLNLKNYAAPRGYTYGQQTTASLHTPPELTLTHPSPTTPSFVDSPLESPTAPVLSLETSSPTLSTTSTASADLTSADSTPVQTPTQEDEEVEAENLKWSLNMENGHFATTFIPSPPVGVSSPTTSPIPVSGPLYGNAHPYTNYPSKNNAGGVEMGTSPPFSDLESVGRSGGSVHWNWGSAAGALGGEGKEVRKDSSSATTLTSGLTPPQRRRGLLHPQKRGSGTSSSSGSGSDSNPKLSTPTPSSTATATPPPPKQKPTPPKLNLPTSTFTQPAVSSPSCVQSPNPRRGPQQQRYGRHYQPMPSSMGAAITTPQPSTPGDSDAIYQALVREWCFAQGPSSSGEMTPVVAKSPSPLGQLVCALGDE